MTSQISVPGLNNDAMMLKKFGMKVHPQGRMERRIVANLIAHLETAGFRVKRVYDGDDFTPCSDTKEAMEVIFGVDEASLRLEKPGFSEHGVLLILGNGNDMIADWSYSSGDPDGFNVAMDAFHADDYA